MAGQDGAQGGAREMGQAAEKRTMKSMLRS